MMQRLLSPNVLLAQVGAALTRDPRASLVRLLVAMMLGALGCALAVYVGTRWLTTYWNFELGFVPAFAERVDPFRAMLFVMTVGPLLLAAAFVAIGSFFGGRRAWRGSVHPALAVAVIGMMPLYVTGMLLFFMPAVLLVALAFFVSCFWWGAGARELLGVPRDDIAEFMALSLIAASVALQIVTALAADLL